VTTSLDMTMSLGVPMSLDVTISLDVTSSTRFFLPVHTRHICY
jgi:hypothetical protein